MSETKDDGGPAFPVDAVESLNPKTVNEMRRLLSGMSLRDYFAAKAMQGFCADPEFSSPSLSESAYRVADNMLKARNA